MMAQQIVETLLDDVDGSVGAETVTFALDGKPMVIDLSEDNAAKLREVLAPYVAAARGAVGASARPAQSPAARPRRDLTEVREWLTASGYPVKDRGRIPAEWMTAWQSKSPDPPAQPAEEPKSRKAPDAVFQPAAS
jgi:Lsr2